ncbi:hypothetical protein RUM44_004129 [Polyplax serrata]|uniref:Protein takeout n=1 Tax=Polyplax serrata TaxID=468196 RepID=A0ABR1B3Q4_POLSC
MSFSAITNCGILLITFITFVQCDTEEIPLLKDRPEWLKSCRRSDPNINECLKDGLQTMFPALARGIPEIDIQPFEPLFLKEIGISKGHGAVSLTGAMHDLFVYGPSNATTTFVSINMEKKRWTFGIEVPYLKLESKYNIKGNILLLPVVGTGDSTIHLRDGKCVVTNHFEFSKIQGREIMKITNMKVDFSVSGMRLHLSNLFNGNKVLGQTVNQFLNKNGLQVIDELKEDIGNALSGVFIEILNNAFRHMPTDLWLPNE